MFLGWRAAWSGNGRHCGASATSLFQFCVIPLPSCLHSLPLDRISFLSHAHSSLCLPWDLQCLSKEGGAGNFSCRLCGPTKGWAKDHALSHACEHARKTGIIKEKQTGALCFSFSSSLVLVSFLSVVLLILSAFRALPTLRLSPCCAEKVVALCPSLRFGGGKSRWPVFRVPAAFTENHVPRVLCFPPVPDETRF